MAQKTIDETLKELKADQAELVKLEQDHAAAKEKVAHLWKQYWPAAEAKKSLWEQLKAKRAAVKAKIDANAELKALVAAAS